MSEEKYVVLNPAEHNRLRFDEQADFSFAANMHMCPLLYTELFVASRFFPVVFPTGDKIILPRAVFSVKPGTNPYVAEDGSWQGGYLPRKMQLYPFALARDMGSDSGVVLFDEKAPQLGENGKLLYNKRGEDYAPSSVLKQAKDALVAYEEEAGKTAVLCRMLQNAGVLQEAGLKLSVDGKQRTVRGFSAVDWPRVTQLDDATLANWARSGLLQLIQSHLQSLQEHFKI